MTTKNVYAAFSMLGLNTEIDLPFNEVEQTHTKEECFELVRGIYQELLKAGTGPYTLLKFKERSNAIARKGGDWSDYYALCCEYVERCLMRNGRTGGKLMRPRPSNDDLPWNG